VDSISAQGASGHHLTGDRGHGGGVQPSVRPQLLTVVVLRRHMRAGVVATPIAGKWLSSSLHVFKHSVEHSGLENRASGSSDIGCRWMLRSDGRVVPSGSTRVRKKGRGHRSPNRQLWLDRASLKLLSLILSRAVEIGSRVPFRSNGIVTVRFRSGARDSNLVVLNLERPSRI
jgi:hypothetical protein